MFFIINNIPLGTNYFENLIFILKSLTGKVESDWLKQGLDEEKELVGSGLQIEIIRVGIKFGLK